MLDTLATWSTGLLALLGVVIPFPGRARKLPGVILRARASSPERGAVRMSATPLSKAEQFAKIGHVISGAVKAATQISDMHDKARIQLEVVEITMDRLLEDLADVMALPPSQMLRGAPVVANVTPMRRAA